LRTDAIGASPIGFCQREAPDFRSFSSIKIWW
jgi:hypothetical protein